MKYFINAFTHFSFKGRVTRKEFWLFALFSSVLAILLGLLLGAFYSKVETYGQLIAVEAIRLILVAGLGFTSLSMQVKRLHDSGRSGNFVYISAVPLVGTIILSVMLCAKTQMKDNQYGAIPEIMSTKENVEKCTKEIDLFEENHDNGGEACSKGKAWNPTVSIVLSAISCVAIIVAMNMQDVRRNDWEAINPTLIYFVLLGVEILCLLGTIAYKRKWLGSVGVWLAILPAIVTIFALVEGSVFAGGGFYVKHYQNEIPVLVCNCIWVIASLVSSIIIIPLLIRTMKKGQAFPNVSGTIHSSVRYREKCYKRIAVMHDYLERGIITQEEYDQIRKDILKNVK